MANDSAIPTGGSGKLKMVTCGGCRAKVFIGGNLAPMVPQPCPKCGHPVIMPTMLRQFELRSVIGAGGMGTVYRALDTMLQREVAVKLMKQELVGDEQAVKYFFREAKALAALNHTNIIHVYTFEKYDNHLYLVMELADNGSMDKRLDAEGHLPELHILDIGIKIASGLDAALRHGMLHRDIKPANILYNAEGEPKLIDFGLAGDAGSGAGDDNTVWGTPYYVAPEKVQRQQETFLSDMYTLAGTLYHGITGHVPFEAPTVEEVVMAQVSTPLTPPNLVVPEISAPTSDAIFRAMAKNPAERFQSYDEFIMELTASRSRLLIAQSQGGEMPEQ